tara:strand:+ start:243 stop:1523 length:1281 start_codon:yes stop_codon:yes gene_type:complete
MPTVTLPNNWNPRGYQLPLWTALEQGCKRAVAVWHRRAGKDATGLHWTTVAAIQRPGIYWHMLPTLAQARKVVWDGRTKDGTKTMDAWPEELIAHRRNDEMKLELKNGSIWQCVGSDNYDSLVGSNPIGVVFSEYSLADPAAWDFIRPILAENDGWALFLYTPRGRNHGFNLYDMAQQTDGWHASLLTVEDTDAMPMQAVEDERAAGMAEEMIRQEFYCSFEAPLFGAYYADQLVAADDEGRISGVPYDPAIPVNTSWDLGIGDSTSIWFYQQAGKERHYIDYLEASGEALNYYVKQVESKPYSYADHYFPHDVQARELIAGKTREEVLRSLGIKPVVIKQHKVDDRIQAVRNALGSCWFDAKKCARGVESLRQYRKEYDEKNAMFKSRPVHDWASHGADAFGYGIMAQPRKTKFEPLEYGKLAII